MWTCRSQRLFAWAGPSCCFVSFAGLARKRPQLEERKGIRPLPQPLSY